MLIRWSAPLFLKLEWTSCGMCFGHQHTATFAVTTTNAAQAALLSPQGHHVRGLECSLVLGSSLQAADNIPSAIGAADTMNTVAMTKVTGWMLDMGFASGVIKVDAPKNKDVYGGATTPAEILGGQRVPPPAEFQRFYTEMSLIVHGVERTSGVGPSRVSASLERFSTGYDPDRHMVMPTGEALLEEEEEESGAAGAAN
jgi:lipid-binding SYLF domain-containing protein